MKSSIETHRQFRSIFLNGERSIHVWLPPGYSPKGRQRYPVLYLHDGQNVFDPETAFIRGQHWEAADSAEQLVVTRQIPPLLIVAVDNAGESRIDEYTPTHNKRMNRGGHADDYGRMLLEELMPWIAARYRVRGGPRYTGLGGSSLGGLLTLYLGLRYPDWFGRLGVMSPSLWWDNRAVLRMIGDAELRPRPRIWLDVGTAEASTERASTRDVHLLRGMLLRRGWKSGRTLLYYEDQGGGHNERAWAHRFPMMLKFLFG